MTAPLTKLGVPVAGSAALAEQPGRQGTAPDRAWLASLEQALDRDRQLSASERRRGAAAFGCAPSIAQPIPPPPVKLGVPCEGGQQASPGVSRLLAESIATGSGPEQREPLRWHAEWAEAGVRVWLGADHAAGDAAQATQVAAIVAELRRQLDGRGVRLLNVTCNGREVWAAEKGNEGTRSHSASTEGP